MNDSVDSAQQRDQENLERERLRLLFVSGLPSSIANLLLAFVMTLNAVQHQNSVPVWSWLVVMLVLCLGRLAAGWHFQKALNSGTITAALNVARVQSALIGLLWAAAIMLFYDPDLGGVVVLLAAGTGIVGEVLAVAGFTPMILSVVLPVFAATAWTLAGGDNSELAIIGIFAIAAGTVFVVAQRMQGAVQQYLKFGFENGHLVSVLSDSKRKSEELNSELSEEIQQRRSVEQALNEARLEAEAANMAKGEFLATMSHEIRTPLNGILPLLDILRGTQLTEDQQDYLNTAYQSSRHLLRIIDDILDYSKIEAGKLDLETVGLNLRKLVDSVYQLMHKTAEAKGLRLQVKIDDDVRLAARGDPVRLRQILTNLVSNAIKFTAKGMVQIHVSKRRSTRTHNEIVFAVKDTGIGLDRKAADRLFKPFSQADTKTTRHYGGTGLGLVICKRLVDMMDGRIGVKSQPKKGSIFWFSVPLQKAMGDAASKLQEVRGSRAILMSADDALTNRVNVFLDNLGVQHDNEHTPAGAMSKLRSANAMGEAWNYHFYLYDVESAPAGIKSVISSIRRDPSMRSRLHLVLLGTSDEIEIPEDLPVVSVLRNADQNQLRKVLNTALNPEALLPDSGDEVQLKISGDDAATSEAASQQQTEKPPPTATLAENRQQLSGTALLVEDNPVNLHVARKIVKLIGLNIEEAHNGEQAVERVKHHQYDLILMDCQMPVMDGYTATRTIREMEQQSGRKTPIIAMTANAMLGDKQKCLDAGMDDYMSKPLDRGLIEQKVKQWLKPGKPQPVKSPDPQPASEAKTRTHVSPVPAAKVAGTLNSNTIDGLREIMEDDFKDLVEVYLQDTPEHLTKLSQAAQAGSLKDMITPAHSLKSTSANLGAEALSEQAKVIELGARQGDLSAPIAKVSGLQAEFTAIAAKLKQYL